MGIFSLTSGCLNKTFLFYSFFKKKSFWLFFCITLPSFISATEVLFGISILISSVKKKRKKNLLISGGWTADTSAPWLPCYIWTLKPRSCCQLQPVHGDQWILSMSVVRLLFLLAAVAIFLGQLTPRSITERLCGYRDFLCFPGW